ncbi:MAG TPA: aromatic-ring-hydroxylating dioxygenase subunit beta [Candidatus Binataceae bacterium]|nr:aromatic-ring-hydroxylating dioxygenase subunit beta [Candidatus Binataceae bacterium]
MARLTRADAEDILYAEARLLDERRYPEWLAMFTADATYWVPANGEGVDPKREVSIIYDDIPRLTGRIERLTSGVAHAQLPPSKTRRVVSNVQIEKSDDNDATAICTFILYELRRNKQRIFAGRGEYRIRFEDARWKIAVKKVVLVNNDEVIDNLTFVV